MNVEGIQTQMYAENPEIHADDMEVQDDLFTLNYIYIFTPSTELLNDEMHAEEHSARR
jgi:hypothetical protein